MSDELFSLADQVLADAKPGEAAEIVVERCRDTQVRVYGGQVESLSSAVSEGVGVRVVVDHRQGFAYAGTLDPAAVADALAEARDNAAFATADEHVGLAEPDGVAVPDLALFDPALGTTATERKVQLATDLERAVLAADPRITGLESADYVDSTTESVVASTTGVRSSSRDGVCYVMANVLAERDGETQLGFGFSVGRDPAALDVDLAAADAAERATRMLGATQPRSQRVTIVLDPFVTAQLISIISGTLTGDAVQKGRSLFADRVGDEIGSPSITLVDDPTDIRAFGASQTDGEGLACRRNALIRHGALDHFVHNTLTARRAGTTSTGSAVRGGFKSVPAVGCRAVGLAPGQLDQDQILAEVGDAILVQSVSGLHSGVNPVSGDFSTGAQGVRVVDGQRGEPLREFTIASTLQKMLRDVVAVGSDVEWLPMKASGVTLAVTDVTVSGA
ncbi:MAG: TldD/PmbA family protein [Acidimicrobiales bacterium]|nr:TldD/PmbA family protein [Acidimicrobiales bacterium]